MGKVGGRRNFGYGKKMDWAGKNALADRYGAGHFATRAAHAERWGQFVNFANKLEVKDACKVSLELISRYGSHLMKQVQAGRMAVAYAQNLLSTVNVVLETLRGDRLLRIQPAEFVGQRVNVRSTAPKGMDRDKLRCAQKSLAERSELNVAAVSAIAREFGLRFREASLLDTRAALDQALQQGKINITEGTKGGRGREVDRWVPVSNYGIKLLTRVAEIQGDARNLIPITLNFRQWRDHANSIWRSVSDENNLAGFHDLRAAYACDRYQQITGYPAPTVAGYRQADKQSDQSARLVIAQELGHSRSEVAAAYIGSAK